MKRFVKYSIVFLSPLIVLLCLYAYFDPFKVVRHYDNYFSNDNYFCNVGAGINRNYFSTTNYLNKNDIYHYDSFIFGNSRSLYYMIDDWKRHIPSESSCYHFSESGGSINGILYKLRLIDSLNEKIRNAIFVVDDNILRNMVQDEMYGIMPPALTHNKNWLKFHMTYFVEWLRPRFFKYWIKYVFTHEYGEERDIFIPNGQNFKYYNPVTNEEPNHVQDSLIAIGEYYNEKTIEVFKGKQEPGVFERLLTGQEQIDALKEIKEILSRHNTNYKIVFSPLYSQKSINPDDLMTLKSIFGDDNVFNFSGVNEITSDYHHYYEASHYHSVIASEIMDSIYGH